MPPRIERYDPRPWHARTKDSFAVWGLILGLCTELIVWALIALASVGNHTITEFKYYIPNPIPAAQPYNEVVEHHTGEPAQ